MDAASNDTRRARGLALAQAKGKRFRLIVGGKYLVPSAQETGAAGYVVDVEAGECSCPDFEERRSRCKHLFAVDFYRADVAPDGTVVTQRARLTYARDERAYTEAQCNEKDHVIDLLHDLCVGVEETPKASNMGRPRIPLADALFASAMKVYLTTSARRASTDLRWCAQDGYLGHVPAFSSVIRTMERPDLTDRLRAMVQESAKPLRAIEREFLAIDSTCLATNSYARWSEEKWGPKGRRRHELRRWVKLHAIIGVKTNAFVAVHVTENFGRGTADCPNLVPLVEMASATGFTVRGITADKAYLSHENVEVIERSGALPFIPFKLGSTGRGSPAMARMWHRFECNAEEYMRLYHQRSNVEASFSALKRIFGQGLRSRTPVAQFNETLLKVLVYNLTRLVHANYALGIESRFWLPPTAGSAA